MRALRLIAVATLTGCLGSSGGWGSLKDGRQNGAGTSRTYDAACDEHWKPAIETVESLSFELASNPKNRASGEILARRYVTNARAGPS